MGCLFLCIMIRCIWALSTLELSPFWRTFNIVFLIIESIVLLVLFFVSSGKSSDDDNKSGDTSTDEGS